MPELDIPIFPRDKLSAKSPKGRTVPGFSGVARAAVWLLALIIPLAIMAPGARAMTFVDVSAASGFTPGMDADIPAGGIAVADFDNNGWPDIFVTGYSLPNRLFFNQGDGTFLDDATVNQQLAGALCSVAAAADFDNDGWSDIYVGCRGDANHLFRNLEGKGFADVTPTALRHDPVDAHAQRTDAVAWGDVDGNGLPDLFIGVYPTSSQPDLTDPDNLDRVVLNLGGGQWLDVAAALPAASLARTALAATFTDIDRDGDSDLYVVNDKQQGNSLWRNDGPGCGGWCLTDIGPASGADRPVFGMGIAVGDIDRDGMSDLYFSSIGEQVLLRMTSQDPVMFEQIQGSAGLDYPGVGWSTILADFDHDGLEDAYLAVGLVPGTPGEFRDQLSRNLGGGAFSDVTAGSGLDNQLPSQSAALIDYDGDGALDLIVGHHNDGYRLYRNTGAAGNSITFQLIGSTGITLDAMGARVEVTTPDGTQSRELRLGGSRGANHQALLHFGVGGASEAQVTVEWPDGQSTYAGILAAGLTHTLIHDPGLVFADSFETTQ